MLGHKNTNVFFLQSEAKRRRMFKIGLGKYCPGMGSSALAWKVSSLWFFWADWGFLPHWGYLYLTQIQNRNRLFFFFNLTLGHTPKVLAHRGTRGGGVDETPLEFLICCSISKRFCYKWKAFDLLQNTRYILWVVALLEVCEITKHGRHFVFYQELEIR